MLVKDYQTHRKSFTVTGTVLTFLLVIVAFVVIVLYATDPEILWAALAFHTVYVGLYWNKRVRASKDGIEFYREEVE